MTDSAAAVPAAGEAAHPLREREALKAAAGLRLLVLALAGVSALALGVTALVSPGSVNGYDVIFGLCAALIAALGGYGFAVRERLRTAECGEED